MAESEEEPEQNHHATTEPTNAQNKVMVVLNKTPDARSKDAVNLQIKQSVSSIVMNRTPIPLKKLKRKHNSPEAAGQISDDKNDEIDFIVLEENIQGVIDDESNQGEQNVCKKVRIKNEKTTNVSSQEIKTKETVLQPIATTQIKPIVTTPNVILSKHSTDGVVSSSETVDSNNEETYFALSLVGILKRLSPHKRAIAKCHILSYLTELEYGSSSLS